jgi:hypothetical protein
MSKSNVPGFAAEATLYKISRQYLLDWASGASRGGGELLLQARMNETFIISPSQCCYCYEDTERLQSICECGAC